MLTRYSIRLPACTGCKSRLRLERFLLPLMDGVLAAAAGVATGRWLGAGAGAVVAVAIMALEPWTRILPLFPVTLFVLRRTIDFAFRDPAYAQAFARVTSLRETDPDREQPALGASS
ncbi:MAG: hypothetical protein ACRENP_25215, partial [Longimicrobiales bacterium]